MSVKEKTLDELNIDLRLIELKMFEFILTATQKGWYMSDIERDEGYIELVTEYDRINGQIAALS